MFACKDRLEKLALQVAAISQSVCNERILEVAANVSIAWLALFVIFQLFMFMRAKFRKKRQCAKCNGLENRYYSFV